MKYLKSISNEMITYRKQFNNDCGKGNKGRQNLCAFILGKDTYRLLCDWG